jgi:hypothetical protein
VCNPLLQLLDLLAQQRHVERDNDVSVPCIGEYLSNFVKTRHRSAFHPFEKNFVILSCCCYLRDGQYDPPNVHGCFCGGPDERLDLVCVGCREVGSVCSNISNAALRSATAAGSSSSLLPDVGSVFSDVRIAAAPLPAPSAGSRRIFLPGTSSSFVEE